MAKRREQVAAMTDEQWTEFQRLGLHLRPQQRTIEQHQMKPNPNITPFSEVLRPMEPRRCFPYEVREDGVTTGFQLNLAPSVMVGTSTTSKTVSERQYPPETGFGVFHPRSIQAQVSRRTIRLHMRDVERKEVRKRVWWGSIHLRCHYHHHFQFFLRRTTRRPRIESAGTPAFCAAANIFIYLLIRNIKHLEFQRRGRSGPSYDAQISNPCKGFFGESSQGMGPVQGRSPLGRGDLLGWILAGQIQSLGSQRRTFLPSKTMPPQNMRAEQSRRRCCGKCRRDTQEADSALRNGMNFCLSTRATSTKHWQIILFGSTNRLQAYRECLRRSVIPTFP